MIRPARESDLEAIAAIYAHYVEHTAITFDLERPTTGDWRAKWAAGRQAGHPWLVTEPDGELAGYATTGPFRPKHAYRPTVETTIYLAPAAVGCGLGRPLYAALLRAAGEASFHRAIAGVTLPNPTSVALHEALGFTPVGVMEQVGHKLGAWHDVGWWQRPLLRAPGAAP